MIQNSTPKKGSLEHLVGLAQADAAQYVEERQSMFPPVRNPMPPIRPTSAERFGRDAKLRVQQVAYADVKKMPIEVACDLWGVRFGNEWVEHKDVQAEELLAAIAQRLINENLLERATKTNEMKTMYRLSTTGGRE